MATLEAIRDTLRDAAAELNPKYACPVDVAGILEKLGIALEFKSAAGFPGKAYLVITQRPTVVVQSRGKSQASNSFDRFSVAHEVGHWVVWRRYGILPSCKTDYWKQEALCNEFAGHLLVPPPFLEGFLQDLTIRHHVYPIFFPKVVASSANVSWDVAARSITALSSSNLAYLRLSAVKSGGSSALAGRPRELKVVCSSLSQKPGSFVADGAMVRDRDLVNGLDKLKVGELIKMPLTLNLGQLQLHETGAHIVRQTKDSWVIQYRTDDVGVRLKR